MPGLGKEENGGAGGGGGGAWGKVNVQLRGYGQAAPGLCSPAQGQATGGSQARLSGTAQPPNCSPTAEESEITKGRMKREAGSD